MPPLSAPRVPLSYDTLTGIATWSGLPDVGRVPYQQFSAPAFGWVKPAIAGVVAIAVKYSAPPLRGG